jgi:hypothetical protein
MAKGRSSFGDGQGSEIMRRRVRGVRVTEL